MQWRRVVLTIVVLILVGILIWVGYERLATGGVVSILVGILILVGYVRLATGRWPDWTGFGEYNSSPRVQRGKTLWDLMQLLIIPAVLASGAYWLNESARQSEQAIAHDNIREAALQTYIDRMAELLIKENLSESEEGSEVRAVARARTLTVLQRLDKERKGALLRFLYEANLIQKDKIVIDLRRADLTGADLTGADLTGTNLIVTDLSVADLSFSDLRRADLTGANLTGANLIFAYMSGADLRAADLSVADLSWAYMRGANLSWAYMRGANLTGANLSNANLNNAKLSNANLRRADLTGADLTEAYLSGAKYNKDTKTDIDLSAAGAIHVNE